MKAARLDVWRWEREMNPEEVEDDAAWLGISLITQCADPNLEIWETNRLHSFWQEGLLEAAGIRP